jgi:hypothetical protein
LRTVERGRAGRWSKAAWRLGVKIRDRELEAGERSPNWETFHRICELYGWAVDVRGAWRSRGRYRSPDRRRSG